MSLEFVRKWYESIPPFQRFIPLVPLDGKIYSPQRVLEEVTKGTELGQKLQMKLETRSFTTSKDLELIAQRRLEWIVSHLPSVVGIGTLTLGGKFLTKDELLKLIREKKGIGKDLIEKEVENVKKLLYGEGL